MTTNDLPQWASRVPQALIARLYQQDALGIVDEDLLDTVGWMLLARCESFVDAVEAFHGRAKCPRCSSIVLHHADPVEVLHCACGWQLTWQDYFKTFQHKQLSGADPVLEFFREYIAGFPAARPPQEKMLQIDRLIHGFHYNLQYGPTRTTGVNLIEGRYHEVVDFLDQLTYGDASASGMYETRVAWRKIIHATGGTWNDPRLLKPEE